MTWSRRAFMKLVLLLSGAHLGGCLGGSDSDAAATPQPSSSGNVGQASQPATLTTPPAPAEAAGVPAEPIRPGENTGPVWDPAPTVQFVEGVPAVISVRQFVRDPELDPLVIQLRSGTLLPGIMWNAADGSIHYDGRPLGARPDQPVVISGVTFSADDGR